MGDSIIRHVRISNICMTRGAAGVTLMTSYLGHGHVSIEDVIISNVSMTNCAKPLEVLESSIEKATIKDVMIENVNAEVYAFVRMKCENEDTVSNIVLKNWSTTPSAKANPLFPCSNSFSSSLDSRIIPKLFGVKANSALSPIVRQVGPVISKFDKSTTLTVTITLGTSS